MARPTPKPTEEEEQEAHDLEKRRKREEENYDAQWSEFEPDDDDDEWGPPSKYFIDDTLDQKKKKKKKENEDRSVDLSETTPNAELDIYGILMVCVEEIALDGRNGCSLDDLWLKLPRRGIPVPSVKLQQVLTAKLLEFTKMDEQLGYVRAAQQSNQVLVASEPLLNHTTRVLTLGSCPPSFRMYLELIGKSRDQGITLDVLNKQLIAHKLKTTDRYHVIDVLSDHGLIVKTKEGFQMKRNGVDAWTVAIFVRLVRCAPVRRFTEDRKTMTVSEILLRHGGEECILPVSDGLLVDHLGSSFKARKRQFDKRWTSGLSRIELILPCADSTREHSRHVPTDLDRLKLHPPYTRYSNLPQKFEGLDGIGLPYELSMPECLAKMLARGESISGTEAARLMLLPTKPVVRALKSLMRSLPVIEEKVAVGKVTVTRWYRSDVPRWDGPSMLMRPVRGKKEHGHDIPTPVAHRMMAERRRFATTRSANTHNAGGGDDVDGNVVDSYEGVKDIINFDFDVGDKVETDRTKERLQLIMKVIQRHKVTHFMAMQEVIRREQRNKHGDVQMDKRTLCRLVDRLEARKMARKHELLGVHKARNWIVAYDTTDEEATRLVNNAYTAWKKIKTPIKQVHKRRKTKRMKAGPEQLKLARKQLDLIYREARNPDEFPLAKAREIVRSKMFRIRLLHMALLDDAKEHDRLARDENDEGTNASDTELKPLMVDCEGAVERMPILDFLRVFRPIHHNMTMSNQFVKTMGTLIDRGATVTETRGKFTGKDGAFFRRLDITAWLKPLYVLGLVFDKMLAPVSTSSSRSKRSAKLAANTGVSKMQRFIRLEVSTQSWLPAHIKAPEWDVYPNYADARMMRVNDEPLVLAYYASLRQISEYVVRNSRQRVELRKAGVRDCVWFAQLAWLWKQGGNNTGQNFRLMNEREKLHKLFEDREARKREKKREMNMKYRNGRFVFDPFPANDPSNRFVLEGVCDPQSEEGSDLEEVDGSSDGVDDDDDDDDGGSGDEDNDSGDSDDSEASAVLSDDDSVATEDEEDDEEDEDDDEDEEEENEASKTIPDNDNDGDVNMQGDSNQSGTRSSKRIRTLSTSSAVSRASSHSNNNKNNNIITTSTKSNNKRQRISNSSQTATDDTTNSDVEVDADEVSSTSGGKRVRIALTPVQSAATTKADVVSTSTSTLGQTVEPVSADDGPTVAQLNRVLLRHYLLVGNASEIPFDKLYALFGNAWRPDGSDAEIDTGVVDEDLDPTIAERERRRDFRVYCYRVLNRILGQGSRPAHVDALSLVLPEPKSTTNDTQPAQHANINDGDDDEEHNNVRTNSHTLSNVEVSGSRSTSDISSQSAPSIGRSLLHIALLRCDLYNALQLPEDKKKNKNNNNNVEQQVPMYPMPTIAEMNKAAETWGLEDTHAAIILASQQRWFDVDTGLSSDLSVSMQQHKEHQNGQAGLPSRESRENTIRKRLVDELVSGRIVVSEHVIKLLRFHSCVALRLLRSEHEFGQCAKQAAEAQSDGGDVRAQQHAEQHSGHNNMSFDATMLCPRCVQELAERHSAGQCKLVPTLVRGLPVHDDSKGRLPPVMPVSMLATQEPKFTFHIHQLRNSTDLSASTSSTPVFPSTVALPWMSLDGGIHEPLWLVLRLLVVGLVSTQPGLSRVTLKTVLAVVLSGEQLDVLLEWLLEHGVLAEEKMEWSSSNSSALMLGIHFRKVMAEEAKVLQPKEEEVRMEMRSVEI